jgi:hypothetical protein
MSKKNRNGTATMPDPSVIDADNFDRNTLTATDFFPTDENNFMNSPTVDSPTVDSPTVDSPTVDSNLSENDSMNNGSATHSYNGSATHSSAVAEGAASSDFLEADPVVEEAKLVARDNTVGKQMAENSSLSRMVLNETKHGADEKVSRVRWEDLIQDRDFNIRDKTEAYKDSEIKSIKEDIEYNGLDTALVVSKREDGKCLVIEGNRRYCAMAWQRTEYMGMNRIDPIRYPLEKMPWKTVPCKVFVGLTPEQETLKMLDQGQVRGLNDVEFFNAVERLDRLGYSETQIVVRLVGDKKKRGLITKHYRALQLPSEVTECYRKWINNDKSGVNMSGEIVNELHKKMNEDRKAKNYDEYGPELKKLWEEVKAKEAVKPSERKAAVKTTVESELKNVRSHSVFEGYLKAVLGAEGTSENTMNDTRNTILKALEKYLPERLPASPEITV